MNGYQVKLPVFEGPFDLLYHLIEDQKINIYDIPIASITAQYLDYLNILEILDMEVASEFLVMAATLLEIKSKMLLPKEKPGMVEDWDEDREINDSEAPDEDLRHGLVTQLLEYKRFKMIALQLRELERDASRIYTRHSGIEPKPEEVLQISISGLELISLYQGLVQRRVNPPVHRVVLNQIGVIERIREIRSMLNGARSGITFQALLKGKKSRQETVLSFVALLEMHKLGEIEFKQMANFRPIQIHKTSDEKRAKMHSLAQEYHHNSELSEEEQYE